MDIEKIKVGDVIHDIRDAGALREIEGKGLSTNDYTNADKSKLEGIEANAQKNKIESIKVNGSDVTPDSNKAVNLSVPTKMSDLNLDGGNMASGASLRFKNASSSMVIQPFGIVKESNDQSHLISFPDKQGTVALTSDIPDVSGKQDTIQDLSEIRSGAAKGETSVQPLDIEDMVKAEPIGSIIPPVNPSEFATKEEISQLGQEVTDLDEVINGGAVIQTIPTSETREDIRMPVTGANWTLSSSAGYNIDSFAVTPGKSYHLLVPKTGSRYTAVFEFGTTTALTETGSGTLPDPVEQGEYTNAEYDIVIPPGMTALYVCYHEASGSPTLTTTVQADGLVDKVEDLEHKLSPLDEVVTPLLENQFGEWKKNGETSSTSTTSGFTGRGLAIAENKTIYKVYFRVASRLASSLITQVKITLRKDTRTGGILATKTISFPASNTSFINVEFDFSDSPVFYSGVIYCTIQGNADMKFAIISASEYAFSANISYCVSTDLSTDVVFTQSTNNNTVPGVGFIDEYIRDLKIGNEQLKEGAVTTPKIADGAVTLEKLADGLISDKSIDINVPATIYAVVGDKLQLYYESIFKVVNPFVFDIKVSCNIGAQYPRYFEVTPTIAQVGDYTLKFVIKDYNGKHLGTKSCTLRVVKSTASPSVNVLCVGASTTVGGEWVGEMKKRLTTNAGTPTKNSGGSTIFTPIGFSLPNVNFVGRKEANGAKLEATGGYNFNSYNGVGTYIGHFYFTEGNLPNMSLGDVYSDGTNQFTITEINIPSTTGGYAGNIGCSCPAKPHTANLSLTKVSGNGDVTLIASYFDFKGNPFLYDGVIDIEQYATDYCNGQIDVVFAYLFSNGIITPYQTDFTTALASMRTFINNFVSAFPNCKFGIVLSQNKDARGGLGVNYGAAESNIWTYEFGMKVSNHNLLTALQEYITEENLANVFIVNNLNEFDYMNDYQQTTKQVNPRSGVTEVFGRNGVHPSTIGYYQIADSATRAFIGKYNENS